MKHPLFWIIDEEWSSYATEERMLKERYPDCDIRYSSYDYQDDLQTFGKDADVIICQVYAEIPQEVIAQLTQCRAIAVYGSGYDRIDVTAAKEKGIRVMNVGGYCNEDIADYVLAGIFYFYKQLHHYSAHVHNLPWGGEAVASVPTRLSHSTLFVLGFGRIGQCVAAKALNNGLSVIAYDPYVDAARMQQLGVQKVSWEDGFHLADYISVHIILNKDTEQAIGYREFQLMKKSACLINAARGRIIHEADLIRGAKEGLFRGAMLDVVANEPPCYEDEIFHVPNIHVTPHISYVSQQSFDALVQRAVENAILGYEGTDSPDWINR